MKHKTVALLFGGKSNEHEISLCTAAAIYRHLLAAGWRVLPLGITREGVWYLFQGTPSSIEDGSWETSPALYRILFGSQGAFFTEEGRAFRPDAVFPAVHGRFCEDGRLQGLLDLWGVPYVGCGVESSVLCMNKCLSKRLVQEAGLPTLPWVEIKDPAQGEAEIRKRLSFPVFIKPARSGSSLGAGRAENSNALQSVLTHALETDPLALAEPCVTARELEVAVAELGGALTVSQPGEVVPNAAFYDFDTKYRSSRATLRIPAPLDGGLAEQARRLAAEIFRLLGCRHLARIDFFLLDGALYFNEINTLPGFTPISMYPRLMEHAGLPPARLLDALLCEVAQ